MNSHLCHGWWRDKSELSNVWMASCNMSYQVMTRPYGAKMSFYACMAQSNHELSNACMSQSQMWIWSNTWMLSCKFELSNTCMVQCKNWVKLETFFFYCFIAKCEPNNDCVSLHESDVTLGPLVGVEKKTL